MKILVTGAAGFIGFHLVKKTLDDGHKVVGLDSINDYYDQSIKYARLKGLGILQDKIQYGRIVNSEVYPFKFIKLKLEDKKQVYDLFDKEKFDAVCNLAAQAGVRYSIEQPHTYIESNIVGFINILEACRHYAVENLSYASSSSVYGLNESYPFSVSDGVDHPVSLYAASKKSNELMAHVYSHLFNIRTTGMRFFTVYGPFGRPDMALFLFTKAILEGRPINVFNNGEMLRDFTYVDDIVDGVTKIIYSPATPNNDWNAKSPNPSSSSAPYKIYNIGNNTPVRLMTFIELIEKALGKKAEKNMKPIQSGDVPNTYAEINTLVKDFDYKPKVSIEEGIARFISWYKYFFNIK